MKFKIQAGGELDLLTKDEMKECLDNSLDNWAKNIAGSFRFRFPAAGTLSIPTGQSAVLFGPNEGYTWSVNRITVKYASIDIYINAVTDSTYQGSLSVGLNVFSSRSLVIPGGSELVAYNPGASSVSISVNALVEEVPNGAEWQL